MQHFFFVVVALQLLNYNLKLYMMICIQTQKAERGRRQAVPRRSEGCGDGESGRDGATDTDACKQSRQRKARWEPAECWTVGASPQLPPQSVVCSGVESTSGETCINTALEPPTGGRL